MRLVKQGYDVLRALQHPSTAEDVAVILGIDEDSTQVDICALGFLGLVERVEHRKYRITRAGSSALIWEPQE